jgi:esterase/lipase
MRENATWELWQAGDTTFMVDVWQWFSGEAHAPFVFAAQSRHSGPRTGALLIHGFLGSPKELRPLGKALAGAGIDAHAPLLPGHGRELKTLNMTRAEDWIDGANRAWDEIVARYERRILLGFSMGGAVALSVASRLAPDRLILIAPLWRVGEGATRYVIPLLPVIKHVMRSYRPFGNTNFDDPHTRQFFQGVDSDLDIDDPRVQRSIREDSVVSMRVIDELRRVSAMGRAAAPLVKPPTLILQGTHDAVITPRRSRGLLHRLGGVITYQETAGDYLLVADDGPGWNDVRTRVTGFATGAAP